MNWVSDRARQQAPGGRSLESTAEQQFNQAASNRWTELLNQLEGDVADFTSQGGSAKLMRIDDTCAAIACATTGINLALRFDATARNIHYDYSSDSPRQSAPEGGILSMRFSRFKCAQLYSADEHLTTEEARRLLLEPVFFPPDGEALAS